MKNKGHDQFIKIIKIQKFDIFNEIKQNMNILKIKVSKTYLNKAIKNLKDIESKENIEFNKQKELKKRINIIDFCNIWSNEI